MSCIERYFRQFFPSCHPNAVKIEEFIDGIQPCVDDAMSHTLQRPFEGEEIRIALFEMSPSKTLRLVGFHALLYQKFWDIVGPAVIGICLRILNGEESMKDINLTHVTLIPKVKKPRKMTEFRPISLCNVITRLLLKPLLIG